MIIIHFIFLLFIIILVSFAIGIYFSLKNLVIHHIIRRKTSSYCIYIKLSFILFTI